MKCSGSLRRWLQDYLFYRVELDIQYIALFVAQLGADMSLYVEKFCVVNPCEK